MFRPRERAFKQFKCPRPQCVNVTQSRHEFGRPVNYYCYYYYCCCYADVTSCFARHCHPITRTAVYPRSVPCVLLTTPWELFTLFMFLLFHHSNRTDICGTVDAACPSGQVLFLCWSVTCCHVVSGVISWCLNCSVFLLFYPDFPSSVNLLEFWLLTAIDIHCHTSFVSIMLTRFSYNCLLQLQTK